MLQPPFNNVIVKVKTKYVRHISKIMLMSSQQKESRLNPADCVNIIGEVAGLPKEISDGKQYEGFSTKDIKVGDACIFSHLVIFQFNERGENQEPQYKNMFTYRGEEYFICNIQQLYAVIREDKVIMVNGFAMLYDFPDPKIVLSASTKKLINILNTELMHIGNPKEGQPDLLELIPSDNILIMPTKTIKYQVGDKPFRIINQSHILARETVTGQVD